MTATADPPRPLGRAGLSLWSRYAGNVADADSLLLLCEATDEREILRRRILRDEVGSPDRKSLRDLERSITALMESVERDRSWTDYGEA